MGILDGVLRKLGGEKRGRLSPSWEFSVDSSIAAPPSVIRTEQKSKVLFGTHKGEVFCIESGGLLWKYEINEPHTEQELLFLDPLKVHSILSAPAVGDINMDGMPEVIITSETGKAYCLNSAGAVIWEFRANGAIKGGAIIEDINGDGAEEIVFGSLDRNLYILSASGTLLAQFFADAPIESQPAFVNGSIKQIVFGTSSGLVHSVSPYGNLLWTFKTNGKVVAQPLPVELNKGETSILIGSFDENLYALSEGGELRWSYRTGGKITSKPAVADLNMDDKPEIVVGSCDDVIYLLSSTGSKMWSFETDFWIASSPLIVDIDGDGKMEIVFGSYDNNVYVLDGEGSFNLDYMPGIASISQQSGYTVDAMTRQPGSYMSKVLWQYKLSGMIVGLALSEQKDGKEVVATTHNGKVTGLRLNRT